MTAGFDTSLPREAGSCKAWMMHAARPFPPVSGPGIYCTDAMISFTPSVEQLALMSAACVTQPMQGQGMRPCSNPALAATTRPLQKGGGTDEQRWAHTLWA